MSLSGSLQLHFLFLLPSLALPDTQFPLPLPPPLPVPLTRLFIFPPLLTIIHSFLGQRLDSPPILLSFSTFSPLNSSICIFSRERERERERDNKTKFCAASCDISLSLI